MTQKEIDKFLDNTKVYVNGKSKEIQEKLFSFGYEWADNYMEILHVQEPFLYIGNSLIFYGNNMIEFMYDKRKEITAEQILSLELTEPSCRPFKDKEECWNEMLKHEPFGWLYNLQDNSYEPFMTEINKYTKFEEIMKEYTFADGSPFGIKEE